MLTRRYIKGIHIKLSSIILALLIMPSSAYLNAAGGVTSAKSGTPEVGYDSIFFYADTTAGIITTVAGNRTREFSGDGGPAINAGLNLPTDAAVDEKGNLFILDAGNKRVRQVATKTGIISTVAGNGASGFSGDG